MNGTTTCGTIQGLNDSGGPGGFALTGALSGATVTQTSTDGGNWQLLNPFGNLAITSLLFTAADTPTDSGDNSDYSIKLVQTSDVPEPTTLGLLGIGLLALGIAGRRRRNSRIARLTENRRASCEGLHWQEKRKMGDKMLSLKAEPGSSRCRLCLVAWDWQGRHQPRRSISDRTRATPTARPPLARASGASVEPQLQSVLTRRGS